MKRKKSLLFADSVELDEEDDDNNPCHTGRNFPEKQYSGDSVLCTDEIYGSKLPEDTADKVFRY